MLKVPQYETQVRPTGYQDAGTPRVINTTDGLARGLNQFAGAVQEFEVKKDELAAEQALQSFVRRTNELLLTGKDPYYGTKGKDSVDRMGTTIESIDEIAREHLGMVQSPRAQALLKKSIDSRITSERARIQTRALEGQKEWDMALAETGAEQAAENIQLYLNDPVKVRASEFALREHVKAANPGMPVEKIDERVETIVSQTVANGIIGKVDTNLGAARSAFKLYRDKLEPEDREKVEAALKTAGIKDTAAAAVRNLRSEFAGNPQAQLRAARERYKGDTEILDEVKRRLASEATLDQSMQKAAERDFYENISLAIDTGELRYSDLSASQLGQLSPEQRNTLASAEQAAISGTRKTNVARWTEAYAADWDDPGFNPVEYMNDLSPSDYQTFYKAVKAHREGKRADGSYFRGKAKLLEVYQENLSDEERLEDFNMLASIEETFIRENNGKKPTQAQLDDMVQTFYKQKVMLPKTGMWSAMSPGINETTLSEIEYDDIPPNEINAIVRAYERIHGVMPSQAQILNAFVNARAAEIRAKRAVQAVNDQTRTGR